MILTLDTLKYNLQLLQEVKQEFPILQDYEDGKVTRETLNGVGLDYYVNLISYIKNLPNVGNQKLIYDNKITYRDVKKMVSELSYDSKAKSIFLKKTHEDFIKVFNDFKTNRRYTKTNNQSYCGGLQTAEPIILNYFIQNNIEFSDVYFKSWMYFKKLEKPKLYSRELKKTQDFIEMFIGFTKEQDFDLRKCNIKSLITELQHRLRPMMKIETGLFVKCITESNGVLTFDKQYLVEDSRINYYGFLEIKITDNKGISAYIPYSNFEEISRQRDDLFKELGL
jgi:hypothetical protein